MTTTSIEFNQSLFHTLEPSKAYLSTPNKQSLQELINNIKKGKKLILVTGEIGCGKSTFVQRAACELGTDTRLLSFSLGCLKYEELIEYIGNELDTGFSTNGSLEKKSARLKELLLVLSLRHVVIFIDQSLILHQKIPGSLFTIVDSNFSDTCCFHLVITGLPGLEKRLKESGLPISALNDACLFQIEPLTADEVISYIQFHLRILTDQGRNLFSDQALKSIIYYSKGLPRLINRLCSLGLLTAKLEEKPTVTPAMIEEVLENSFLLGNECGYSSSYHNELLFDEPIENSQISQNKNDEEEAFGFIETNLSSDHDETVEPLGFPEISQLDSAENNIPEHNLVNVNISIKLVFLTAFVMGLMFSALIGAGLYFLKQTNQASTVKEAAVADTNQLQTENKLKQQLVAALLKRSEQQFERRQLMPPENDNAWEIYQQILALVPDHPQALAGIVKIKETYVLWASQEIKQENYQQAANHYRNALQISPDDQDILQTLRGLDEKQLSEKIMSAPVAKSDLTEEEKLHVQELLLKAEQQLANKQLMTPVEDNAWSTYNKILALSPGHQEANSGINRITETYKLWAAQEIKQDNNKHAIFLFRKALQISPNDAEIVSVLAKIQETESTGTRENSALLQGEFQTLLNDQKGIDELLNFAERQINRKKLTTPEKTSAITVYQTILERFPTHEKALAGVLKIKDTYVLWARHEIKQNNYQHAKYLYGKALAIAPADPEIANALQEIMQNTNKGQEE